ncbi:MAG TPA: SpoIIE family protein phosphatase [Actinomycetota bacterium]|nr:SpoIIE family protein phosphatase [Actinomycetota bacterium]
MPSTQGFDEEADDLYENAPCGYLSTTLDGTIVRANRTFLDWVGYTADAVLHQKRFQDFLTVGGRIYYETHLSPLLRMQGFARELALEIVAADENRMPGLLNAVVKEVEGQPQIIRVVVLPASDRRKYERELLRARRAAEEAEGRARVLAETLQSSLIPPALPEIPGVDVGASFRPAGSGAEIGGDFYDVFEIGQGEWAIVIGDVLGKGARAATVTALIRYTVRAAAIQVRQPSSILALLNDAMRRQHPEAFCTIVCAILRLEVGMARVTLGCGGHPLPILTSGDKTTEVGEVGTLIGVLPQLQLIDKAIMLSPGDMLTFFTDGVTEGRRGSEFFGEERLMRLQHANRHSPAGAVATRVVNDAVLFQEGHPRDDIAVVTLKVAQEQHSGAVAIRT